jgi:hypothetical protein
MPRLIFIPALVVLALLTACGDDEVVDPTPVPASPTTGPGATTVPPVDGTVDPLGFGGTDPVTIKSNPDPISGVAILRDVRVGAHPEQGGWDRIVFEFQDVLPEGTIQYVDGPVVSCGSGLPVQLQGGARLQVKFTPADAHNQMGQSTIPNRIIGGPGNAILESKLSCDFEAHTEWGIGVTGKQRFKVTRLTNPTRLVIDIKW